MWITKKKLVLMLGDAEDRAVQRAVFHMDRRLESESSSRRAGDIDVREELHRMTLVRDSDGQRYGGISVVTAFASLLSYLGLEVKAPSHEVRIVKEKP